MNRIVLAALKNFYKLPPAWFKLRKYAKHTDDYSFEEKYAFQDDLYVKAKKG